MPSRFSTLLAVLTTVLWLTPAQAGSRLPAQADAGTYRVMGEKDFDFQYLTPLGMDKDAFFLATKRIPFPEAHKARILAPNNNGDCMYLLVAGGKLLRINENARKVEPVAGAVDVAKIQAIPTRNRYAAPMYFLDARAVYFYDIHNNRLLRLPQADPKNFEGHVATYGFQLYWGLDAKHAYAGAKRIAPAHRPTFEYVGWVYAKDKAQVYVLSNEKWSIVKGADPETFHTTKGRGIDARDKNHCYRMGRVRD